MLVVSTSRLVARICSLVAWLIDIAILLALRDALMMSRTVPSSISPLHHFPALSLDDVSDAQCLII